MDDKELKAEIDEAVKKLSIEILTYSTLQCDLIRAYAGEITTEKQKLHSEYIETNKELLTKGAEGVPGIPETKFRLQAQVFLLLGECFKRNSQARKRKGKA
jgi:hypothetical protein